jgi:hypothetical protein
MPETEAGHFMLREKLSRHLDTSAQKWRDARAKAES